MPQSAADIAAELTEGLDDSLQPIDDKVVAVVDEEKKDDPVQEDGAKDDTVEDPKKDEEKLEDEGYTIDEIEAEDDKPIVDEPKKIEPSQYTPEQQYILDNLPPIKVRGMVGDAEEVKEYTVFDPSQLPQGFKYLDDRDRDIATKGFGSLETRAIQLQNDFRTQEGQKAQKAFKEQEERADWEDIASLQKSGELPKFKIKPTEKDFDSDPTSQLIDKVLDFKEELNNKYLEDYNKGRPYRHIGFDDAYSKYLKANPPEKKTEAEITEDKERKALAKRTAGANGDPAKTSVKAPPMNNKRDIDNFIDSLEF